MDQKKGIGKKIGTQPVQLIDLLTYQEDAIVSRTLIDQKAGTVTLFAFDKGQGLSEHTAPYTALINLIDGEAEIRISGKTHPLHEGEIVLIPAEQPHALKAVTRLKMLLTMIQS
ncbi:cupin domain-containing protein [Candidatus Bathyarchaeota archaeon]|nr:cupin domain-containing protein [Candidatus Bathyarchaeota archaeon]